tara:strand:+ start:481 stop:1095 length:615 start_codon:yes stop_codon:yes gene_type:complete
MKHLVFIVFLFNIFFITNIFSQEVNEKMIFEAVTQEEKDLVTNLNHFLKICFINTPQRSINYFPQEVFEVTRENSSIYLSIKEVENKFKKEAREKKSRMPLGGKEFIVNELLSRVERENHIIYLVGHTIKEDNNSDRLSSSIKRLKNDKEEPVSILMKTICVYNKFNENWQFFEHKNKVFSEQVLEKMFELNTALEILDFNKGN